MLRYLEVLDEFGSLHDGHEKTRFRMDSENLNVGFIDIHFARYRSFLPAYATSDVSVALRDFLMQSNALSCRRFRLCILAKLICP